MLEEFSDINRRFCCHLELDLLRMPVREVSDLAYEIKRLEHF